MEEKDPSADLHTAHRHKKHDKVLTAIEQDYGASLDAVEKLT